MARLTQGPESLLAPGERTGDEQPPFSVRGGQRQKDQASDGLAAGREFSWLSARNVSSSKWMRRLSARNTWK